MQTTTKRGILGGQKVEYRFNIKGKQVRAFYTPGRAKTYGTGKNAKPFATQHWEFWTKGPGPISETGYRSHFVNGTRRQLGITPGNQRNKTIELAEVLAAEYKGVTK